MDSNDVIARVGLIILSTRQIMRQGKEDVPSISSMMAWAVPEENVKITQSTESRV
jgi:hypothetical protein